MIDGGNKTKDPKKQINLDIILSIKKKKTIRLR